VNGKQGEIIGLVPFMLSLSKHGTFFFSSLLIHELTNCLIGLT